VDKAFVSDEEELYRSVRAPLDFDEYTYTEENELVITPKAFFDRGMEPSVDRAILRGGDPELSKKSVADGVVGLNAGAVRSIIGIQTVTGDKMQTVTKHAVDVKYDPLEENDAHALIIVDPHFYGSEAKKKKTFKQLRVALARLANEGGWLVEPASNSKEHSIISRTLIE